MKPWTKLICLGQKIFCPGRCTGQKQKSFLSCGQNFCHGQNYFALDKSDFVQDKKYFVRADGQGISCRQKTPEKSRKLKYIIL